MPVLLPHPHAKIVSFDKYGVGEIAYEDTEHFFVARDFLNHDPRRLEQLFDDSVDD